MFIVILTAVLFKIKILVVMIKRVCIVKSISNKYKSTCKTVCKISKVGRVVVKGLKACGNCLFIRDNSDGDIKFVNCTFGSHVNQDFPICDPITLENDCTRFLGSNNVEK